MLVAAAVILIPEMLSGPDRRPEEPASAAGEAPLKTYTIDLTKSPTAQSAIVDEPVPTEAPPPESSPVPEPSAPGETAPPTVAQANPEPERAEAPRPVPVQTDAPPSQPQRAPDQRAPEPQRETRTEPPPPRVATTPPPQTVVPAAAGWAVQLGSFSSRATADGMVRKLQADGHEAFVMPVKSGGATLYRVRIGPMKDRESAAKVLSRVKTTVPAATVVKHP
ncbi:SPOR domain-containing protein [Povalibacter uvarum]|uniref:SPOR domain-containing protein n=1 Tax=Povalibacter uvarum TaxID=732238 RepID=UPI00161F046F|nr:SPOR domain-containing protein [Povalibacter uvarum]